MEQFFKDAQAIERKREGLLGLYMDELAQHFADAGYSRSYGRRQLQLAGEFSQWLQRHKVDIASLKPDQIKKFLRHRALGRKPRNDDVAACQAVYDLLRQKGLLPTCTMPARTPAQVMADEFRLYLRQERQLAATTIVRYVGLIEEWLADRFGDGPADLLLLSAAEIVNYIQRQAPSLARKTAKMMTTALRSFLQYARYRGYLHRDLALSIPPIADWSRTSIPRSLPVNEVQQVLAHCNRQTGMGRRDYAILLLLARLGLRGGEVASLRLDDINWPGGCLTVRGKGHQGDQLPLPSDVGKAIVDYLKHGRPRSTSRLVFLRSRAPVAGFKDQRSVGTVVRHALKRAGIDSPYQGAHQFDTR